MGSVDRSELSTTGVPRPKPLIVPLRDMSYMLTNGTLDFVRLREVSSGRVNSRGAGRTFATAFFAAAAAISSPYAGTLVVPVSTSQVQEIMSDRIMFWISCLRYYRDVKITYATRERIRIDSLVTCRVIRPARNMVSIDSSTIGFVDPLAEFADQSGWEAAAAYVAMRGTVLGSKYDDAIRSTLYGRIMDDCVGDDIPQSIKRISLG